MTKLITKPHQFAAPALSATLLLSACGVDGLSSSTESNDIVLEVADVALAVGALKSINGSYGPSCTDRAGHWSLTTDGSSGDYAPLSVVSNDVGCVLTLDSVRAGSGVGVLFVATSPFDLTNEYGEATMFLADDGSWEAIFGSAKLTSLGFTEAFSITVLLSDDPNLTDVTVTAAYAVQSASVSDGVHPAPDYTVDMTGISLQTDANGVVQSAQGSAILVPGAVHGQTYVVDYDTLPLDPYHEELDQAYVEGTPTSLTPESLAIPASAFGLEGLDLNSTTRRTIVIANETEGMRSYQSLMVTFRAIGAR